jgi:hypothetical protein
MSVSLVKLRMDAFVGFEMLSWWRQIFWHYTSILELLAIGNGSGRHVGEGVLKTLGEQTHKVMFCNNVYSQNDNSFYSPVRI